MSEKNFVVARNNAIDPRDLLEEYMVIWANDSDRWADNPRRATYMTAETANTHIYWLEASEDTKRPRYRYHMIETSAFDPSERDVPFARLAREAAGRA